MNKEINVEEIQEMFENEDKQLNEMGIIKNKTPNKEQLNRAITNLSNKYPGLLSKDKVKNELQNNKFRGIYNLTQDEYEIIEGKSSVSNEIGNVIIRTMGFFKYEKRYIALLDEVDDIETITHEILHAYFNQKLNKIIKVDSLDNSKKINYGYGLEEGVVTALSLMKNINDIHNVDSNMYGRYICILKQLSIIYNNLSQKKDRNLMEYIVKKPEELLPIIFKMYYLILKSNKSSTNYEDNKIEYIAKKCALDLIVGLDQIEKNIFKESNFLFSKAEYINALMLQQLSPSFEFKEDKKIVETAFLTDGYKQVYNRAHNKETILLCNIFGVKPQEDTKMIEKIEYLNAEGVIEEERYIKYEQDMNETYKK